MFEPFVCAAMEEEIRCSNYSHGPNHKLSTRIFEKLAASRQHSGKGSSAGRLGAIMVNARSCEVKK
jgi:hypothetical protein